MTYGLIQRHCPPPQKPLYKSYKQDPRKIKEYLAHTYPEAVEKTKKYKARLYFIDEAAFRSDAHRGTTWGKIGETPVIKDTGGRFGFKLISAISARGEMHFDVIEGRMNSEKFIDYLRLLQSDADYPILVIADNARYRNSMTVKSHFAKNGDSFFTIKFNQQIRGFLMI